MTAVSAPLDRTHPGIGRAGRIGPIVAQLARRSIILVVRLPSAFIPSIVFPVFLIIAFSGSFSGLSRSGAFTNAHSWYAALAIVQGCAFVGVGAGFTASREIESGFFDRLLLAPAPRISLLLGPAAASMIRVLVPFFTVVALAVLMGATIPGGLLGLVVLLIAAEGTALLHCFWTIGIAYRAKSQRAAPIMQIGVFVTIFLASAQVPLRLMNGWLHSVARVNPMTNVLRMARAGLGNDPNNPAGHVLWSNVWGGGLALAVFVTLAFIWAARGLQKMVP